MTTMTYETAKKYFKYVLAEDYGSLKWFFDKESPGNFKIFLSFVQKFWKEFSRYYSFQTQQKLKNQKSLLQQSQYAWNLNMAKISTLNVSNIYILAKPLYKDVDLIPLYSSACSSTNEYSLKIRKKSDLHEIMELCAIGDIEVTECVPELNLKMLPPIVVIRKIKQCIKILQNCGNNNMQYQNFACKFSEYLQQQEAAPIA